MKRDRNFWIEMVYCILSIFLVSQILYILRLFKTFHISWFAPTNFEVLSQWGDFAGGVLGSLLTFAGTLLLYVTFKNERDKFRKSSFNDRFYKLIDLHRQNIDELIYREGNDTYLKRAVFKPILARLMNIYEDVNRNFKIVADGNYASSDIEKGKRIKDYFENNLKTKHEHELFKLKLAFGYLFYGFDYYLTRDPSSAEYAANLEISTLIKYDHSIRGKNDHTEGLSSTLGHYFRLMYQIVKMVADAELSEDEKYNYVKVLRSMLSDYEQILLFYHGFSVMGKKWYERGETKDRSKMCYISRFRLIKNMPNYYKYWGIKPGVFFEEDIKAWKNMGKDFFEILM